MLFLMALGLHTVRFRAIGEAFCLLCPLGAWSGSYWHGWLNSNIDSELVFVEGGYRGTPRCQALIVSCACAWLIQPSSRARRSLPVPIPVLVKYKASILNRDHELSS